MTWVILGLVKTALRIYAILAPAIAAALARLEKDARRNGQAIATGSGLDVTIETVAEWAKTLQEKGILLVPVSAAYKGRAT